MARIPAETLEEIKNAVNIADYIGQTVALKKQGQNLFGVCPFHAENTPSFSVNEEKQIFYCFSCHRGGSVFKFVQELDKLAFPQAVKKVADFAGIPLTVDEAPQKKEDPRAKRQKEILKLVQDFMHHLLMNTASGEEALAYVHGRGMTDDILTRFGVGFAPDDRGLLRTFLSKQGVSDDDMRSSGLFVDHQDGVLASRFTNRVMFPLRDGNGVTVGFSGRTLQQGKQVAKYLNSPETLIFNKSDLLFNLDEARDAVRDGSPFYLFEGFMDVISAYQAGVPAGVASMGTALTRDQIRVLERYGNAIVVCYDGDNAGQEATIRALDLLAGSKLDVSAVLLPGEQDPDEFIKAQGAPAFVAQLEHVLTPTAYTLHHLARGVDMDNDHAKFAYIDAALAVINRVQDQLEREVYVGQLAERTAAPVDALREKLAGLAPAAPVTSTAPDTAVFDDPFAGLEPPPEADLPPADWGGAVSIDTAPAASARTAPLGRLAVAERELLAYMFTDADTTLAILAAAPEWAPDEYGTLLTDWCTFAANHELTIGVTPPYQEFLDTLNSDSAELAAAALARPLPPIDPNSIENLLQVISREQQRSQLARIKAQLKDARQVGDTAAQNRLSMDYFNLMRQLQASR